MYSLVFVKKGFSYRIFSSTVEVVILVLLYSYVDKYIKVQDIVNKMNLLFDTKKLQ